MHGSDAMQESMFTMAKLEDFVPVDYPLRSIRLLVNQALARLNGLFNVVHADMGRELFFTEVMTLADKAGVLSKEHFSVDGTLNQAWASQKSFRLNDGSDDQTLGADKAYDTADFVADCRARNVTPHVASNTSRRGGSAIDARTTRHLGYALTQIIPKRIEEHFGWGKTVGRIRQTVYRWLKRVDQHFKLTMTASDIVRMARIMMVVQQEISTGAIKAHGKSSVARATRQKTGSNYRKNSLNTRANIAAVTVLPRISTAC